MMRRCSNCGKQTQPGFATDTYTRQGRGLEVTVSGIPAEVCSSCGETYIDMETAKQVARLVTPLLEAARQPFTLPVPTVSIAFPAQVPAGTK